MKKIIVFYAILNILLFLYSFTQVDLGLTFLRNQTLHQIEMSFKQIGYFQRPFSTYIYIGFLFIFFGFYLFLLNLCKKGLINRKEIWRLIIIQVMILVFSYNAFSYDLFNYIFDARILTFYHQNPYLHTALDYPSDHMLSFMHWTHRTYPYGPTWLLFTVPVSFIGSNIFLLTFFLFKGICAAAFLGTCYFVEKILNVVYPKEKLVGLAFFAFNPLIIFESLVSSHNDILMMFFVMWGLYLLFSKKYFKSTFSYLLSVGVKFATIFLLPVFLFVLILLKNKKNLPYDKIFIASIMLMVLAVVAASFRSNFQPWYLIYVIPFSAILSRKFFITIPTIVMSFFSLLIYVPFLYTGNWDPPIPQILFWIITTGIVLSMFITIFFVLRKSVALHK